MKRKIINQFIEIEWGIPFNPSKFVGDDCYGSDEDGYICSLIFATAGKNETGSDFLRINIPTITFDPRHFDKLEAKCFPSESERQFYFEDKILFDYRTTQKKIDLMTMKTKVLNRNVVTFFNELNELEFLLLLDIYSFDFHPNSAQDKPVKMTFFSVLVRKQIWNFLVKTYLYQYDCLLNEYKDAISSGRALLENKDLPDSILKFINLNIKFWEDIIEEEFV